MWIGSKADPDEARLIEEIAEEMFNNVSRNSSGVPCCTLMFIRFVHVFSWNRVMELYLKRLLTFEDAFYVGKDVIPYCV